MPFLFGYHLEPEFLVAAWGCTSTAPWPPWRKKRLERPGMDCLMWREAAGMNPQPTENIHFYTRNGRSEAFVCHTSCLIFVLVLPTFPSHWKSTLKPKHGKDLSFFFRHRKKNQRTLQYLTHTQYIYIYILDDYIYIYMYMMPIFTIRFPIFLSFS